MLHAHITIASFFVGIILHGIHTKVTRYEIVPKCTGDMAKQQS